MKNKTALKIGILVLAVLLVIEWAFCSFVGLTTTQTILVICLGLLNMAIGAFVMFIFATTMT